MNYLQIFFLVFLIFEFELNPDEANISLYEANIRFEDWYEYYEKEDSNKVIVNGGYNIFYLDENVNFSLIFFKEKAYSSSLIIYDYDCNELGGFLKMIEKIGFAEVNSYNFSLFPTKKTGYSYKKNNLLIDIVLSEWIDEKIINISSINNRITISFINKELNENYILKRTLK